MVKHANGWRNFNQLQSLQVIHIFSMHHTNGIAPVSSNQL